MPFATVVGGWMGLLVLHCVVAPVHAFAASRERVLASVKPADFIARTLMPGLTRLHDTGVVSPGQACASKRYGHMAWP